MMLRGRQVKLLAGPRQSPRADHAWGSKHSGQGVTGDLVKSVSSRVAYAAGMHGAIAPTDFNWYEFLRHAGDLEEVNFWTPSTHHAFRGDPFSPFLFKLKAPHNAICGFGYFARYSPLPDWLAWEAFGKGNGCETLEAMRTRISGLRRGMNYRGAGPRTQIGCILLVQPVFFAPIDWIPQPEDWPPRSLRPTRYDLSSGEGLRAWEGCLARA